MSNESTPGELSELSRHYDSILWTVTTIWAAAVGGLLLFCIEHYDPWLAIFGLFLTVAAMFFAYNFRVLRRRVHRQMSYGQRQLFVGGRGVRQWDVLAVVFLALVFLWARVLLRHSCCCRPLLLLAALLAGAGVGALWALERWPRDDDA